jgi:LysM repeat protein
MKSSNLSVKRRPAKKGAFRTLFANVRRQQRAVAATPAPEIEGDVPNLGVARALVVILIIHVVAIGGIFAHSKWVEKDGATVAVAAPEIQPTKPLRDAGTPLPKLDEADEPYQPKAGDTYASIAAEFGVTEQALREANSNIEIRPSRILRIPQRTFVASEPEELVRLRQGSAVLETADAMPDEEAAPPPVAIPVDEMRNAEMVETAGANSAVVVKPRVAMQEPSPARQSGGTAASAGAAAFNRSYTVKPGDTFWRIAQAHGSSPEAVMKANGISDPRKLKPGMKLRVP